MKEDQSGGFSNQYPSATGDELTEKIQAVLVEALRVPADLVPADLAFGDLPQWDSMGHMEVMMYLEQYFSVEINNDTIANLTSIPIIRQHIIENGYQEGKNVG